MMNNNWILLLIIISLSAGCIYDPSVISPKPTSARPHCGDSVVDKSLGEECDDGNQINGDGCENNCKLSPDKPVVPKTFCGNGYVESGEECDDGNQADGDGCSKKCKIEDGYTCSGASNSGDAQKIVLHIRYNKLFFNKASVMSKSSSKASDADDLEKKFNNGTCLNGENNPLASIMPADKSFPPSGRGVGHPQPAKNVTCNAFEKSIFDRWNVTNRTSDDLAGTYDNQDIVLEKGVAFSKVTGSDGRISYMLANRDSDKTYATFYPFDGFIPEFQDIGVGKQFASVYNHNSGNNNSDEFVNFYLAEFRVWFKYNPTNAQGNDLIFNGDDDYWVFINSIQVQNKTEAGQPVKTWGSHGVNDSTQLKASLVADTVKDGVPFNSTYKLKSGEVYEIAFFLINRAASGSMGITLPDDIVGPSYCSKCGNGIVEYGETCETSYIEGGDYQKANTQCDASTCTILNKTTSSCGYLSDKGLVRSYCQDIPFSQLLSLRK